MKYFFKAAALAGVVLAFGATGNAQADEAFDFQVNYDRTANVETIYGQVKAQVTRACRKANRGYMRRTNLHLVETCRVHAMADAMSKIGNPELAELHDRLNGRGPDRNVFAEIRGEQAS